MSKYILDACALLSVLNKEDGGEIVRDIIDKAKNNTVIAHMSIVNLLEVYYGVFRVYGEDFAENFITNIKESPIEIIDTISEEVFKEAGRLKANYQVSLADSFVLAEASVSGFELLTSDHHEFDVIEQSEKIVFHWIR